MRTYFNRRQFIGRVIQACLVLGTSVGSLGSLAVEAAKNKKSKVVRYIDPKKNPTAISLKYVELASQSTVRTIQQANCTNCIQYKKLGEEGGVEYGRCNMLTGGVVKGPGWCTSWVKNPKVFK
ncbi:MAG: high-potential iron-sulfur protein [Bdellovibrionales bacterium]|nr:high-potential iron-sulfur protein [Bdellovibrionales bacterium]